MAIQSSPVEATSMYYDYTKEDKSPLMDKIIEDTLPRFNKDIKADGVHWKELYTFLEDLELVKLSQAQYDKIWEAPKH